jgi:hypothetical protein
MSEFMRAWKLLHRQRVDGPWYDMGKHKRAWNREMLVRLNNTAIAKTYDGGDRLRPRLSLRSSNA